MSVTYTTWPHLLCELLQDGMKASALCQKQITLVNSMHDKRDI